MPEPVVFGSSMPSSSLCYANQKSLAKRAFGQVCYRGALEGFKTFLQTHTCLSVQQKVVENLIARFHSSRLPCSVQDGQLVCSTERFSLWMFLHQIGVFPAV